MHKAVLFVLHWVSLVSCALHHSCNHLDDRQMIEIAETLKIPDMVDLLKTVTSKHSDATWLQIGSNTLDRKMNINDPTINVINNIPLWNKVFVEPLPVAFQELQANTKDWPNTKLLNVAVSEGVEPEEVTSFYCLAEAMQPGWDKTIPTWLRTLPEGHPDKTVFKPWANQVCSLNPMHVTNHFPNQPQSTVNVSALSFARMLSKFDIRNVHVILIDTESYDYKVLKQVPLSRMKPSIIIWEHVHIAKEEQAAALEYVRSYCYATYDMRDGNTLALLLRK